MLKFRFIDTVTFLTIEEKREQTVEHTVDDCQTCTVTMLLDFSPSD